MIEQLNVNVPKPSRSSSGLVYRPLIHLIVRIRDGINYLFRLLANLINISNLNINPVISAFSKISDFNNVINVDSLWLRNLPIRLVTYTRYREVL